MPRRCTLHFAGFGDEELEEDSSKNREHREMTRNLLVQNPFYLTGLTLDQEEDLLSEAEDGLTVLSSETDHTVRRLSPPITISSASSLGQTRNLAVSCKQENVVKVGQTPLDQSDSGISSSGLSAISDEKVCPWFRLVPGTTFAVDALQHAGVLPPAVIHFVTHFREGQELDPIGLFGKTLVMTRKMADRVKAATHLDERCLRLVELNQTTTIDGIRVTALNGHRPGLEMFFFQTDSGLNLLHTGECQPCAAMEEESIFWNSDVHVILMNTSYLSRSFTVQNQLLSVMDVCGLVRANQERFKQKLLIICGKSLAVKELAKGLNFMVWIQPGAAALTTAEQLPRQRLVTDLSKANIHVLANDLRYDQLLPYLDSLPTIYGTVLALRPSFLAQTSFNRDHIAGADPKPAQQRDSYARTGRFLHFLKPLEVISTGDNDDDDDQLNCESATSAAVRSCLPEGSVQAPVPAGTLSVTVFTRRPCCSFCDALKLKED